MNAFEKAKSEQSALHEELDAAGAALKAFPRGPMGLVSEAVRVSPEYRIAKARADKAFAALRQFNVVFVKVFKKELRAERKAKYG